MTGQGMPDYVHLQPPKSLPGGGVQIRVRAKDFRIHTITIPRRRATVTGIHEAVMAAIQTQPEPPATP